MATCSLLPIVSSVSWDGGDIMYICKSEVGFHYSNKVCRRIDEDVSIALADLVRANCKDPLPCQDTWSSMFTRYTLDGASFLIKQAIGRSTLMMSAVFVTVISLLSMWTILSLLRLMNPLRMTFHATSFMIRVLVILPVSAAFTVFRIIPPLIINLLQRSEQPCHGNVMEMSIVHPVEPPSIKREEPMIIQRCCALLKDGKNRCKKNQCPGGLPFGLCNIHRDVLENNRQIMTVKGTLCI